MTYKIATQPLRVGWAVAYPAGAEVPDHALDTEVAKQNGWADYVVGPNTKAATEAREAAGGDASATGTVETTAPPTGKAKNA